MFDVMYPQNDPFGHIIRALSKDFQEIGRNLKKEAKRNHLIKIDGKAYLTHLGVYYYLECTVLIYQMAIIVNKFMETDKNELNKTADKWQK